MWNNSASWSVRRLLHRADISHVFGAQENRRDRDGLGWKGAAPSTGAVIGSAEPARTQVLIVLIVTSL